MRQSWRLLLNCRAFLQKPISFSCSKVRSSSISSPFHTESRTQVTGTTKSSNSYRSLDSKAYISRHFSYAGDTSEEKRDEIDKEEIEQKRRVEKQKIEQNRTVELRRIKQTWTVEQREIEKTWDRCFKNVVWTLIKFSNPEDIERQLQHTEIDADLIKNVLQGFESNPDVAKRFFNFILDQYRHSTTKEMSLNLYQLYNSMLCVFAVNGLFDEFWDLAQTMNTKTCLTSSSCSSSSGKEQRYLIDVTAYRKVSKFFQKHELDKLNTLFVIQCIDNSMLKIAILLNRIKWYSSYNFRDRRFDDIISSTLAGDFVKLVLEQECVDHEKTLMLFRWIHGTCLREQHHDESTLRFIASVLSKGDLDKHWKVIHDIKHERDIPRGRIVSDLIRFYANELARPNTTPSVNCCIYLLMKFTLADSWPEENLDHNILDVVDAFQENGGILTDSMVGDVISMLTRVNKTKDLNSLAYVVMSDEHLSNIEYRPRRNMDTYSTSNTSYKEDDREQRARLIFSRLQKETSSCTI